MVAFQSPPPPEMGMEQAEPEYAPLIDPYVGELDMVREIEKLMDRARSAQRTQAELNWFVNCQWKANEPWYRLTEDRFAVDWLSPEKRSRYVNVNKVQEIVETLVGHMLFPPRADAKPTSPDPTDRFRARSTRDLGNHLIHSSRQELVLGDVLEDIQVCGHGVIKHGWDPTIGPSIPVFGAVACDVCGGSQAIPGPDGLPCPCFKCTAQGMLANVQPGEMLEEQGREPAGDVFCERRRPWNVFHDTADLDNIRELVDCAWMTKAEAWERYGSVVNLSEDEMESSSSYSAEYPELAFSTETFGGISAESDRVYVREYWKARCEKYPRGLYGLAVGSHVIFFGPMPKWCKNEIPYVFIKGFEAAGTCFPRSTVDYIIPLQLALNDIVSSLRARQMMSVKPRLFASYKNNLKFIEKDGLSIVQYDPGIRGEGPKEFALGPASSETAELIEMLQQWMDSISGAVDAIKGQIEGEADSAKALAWLEDRAAVRFKRLRMRLVAGVQKSLRIMLAIAKENYHDGRAINVFGAGRGKATLRAFKTTDVTDPQDVEVNISPDMYLSAAARNGQVMEMVQSTALDHPIASKLLEFGGVGEFFEDKALHEAKADDENETLRNFGFIDEVFEGEDHEVHAKFIFSLINEWRQTRTPETDALLPLAIEHWQMHNFYLQQQQMAMQMAQDGAAAGFGKQGAADPGNQAPTAQEGAAASGQVPGEVQEQIAGEPGPPGSQPSLARASAASGPG